MRSLDGASAYIDAAAQFAAQVRKDIVSASKPEFRDVFPPLRIVESFWVALDPRKLALAAIAVLVVGLGQSSINALPFAPERPQTVRWPWEGGAAAVWSSLTSETELEIDRSFFEWLPVLDPARKLIATIKPVTQARPNWSIYAYCGSSLLWFLFVWTVFGGAISRIAGLQFARDRGIGPVAATRFSISRLPQYVVAPGIAVAGVTAIWLFGVVDGLIGRIPVAGEFLVGLAWCLSLAAGALAVLLGIGFVTGWPLMVATITVEDCDGFEGFTRAFNYQLSRPGAYFVDIVVAALFGSLMSVLVVGFLGLTVQFASASVGSGMGHASVATMVSSGPDWLSTFPPDEADQSVGPRLAGAWLCAAAALANSFAHSFFWTSATVIFFLLRKREDNVDYDEIHIAEETRSIPSLVGVAASDQPVTERPVRPPGGVDFGDDPNVVHE